MKRLSCVAVLMIPFQAVIADELALTETLLGKSAERSAVSPAAPNNAPLLSGIDPCENAADIAGPPSAPGASSVDCPAAASRAPTASTQRPVREFTGRSPGSDGMTDASIGSRNGRPPNGARNPSVGLYPSPDWRSEFQNLLGDSNYDQLASAYVTIRKLDQWVDVALEDYGLNQANPSSTAHLKDLSQRLNAGLLTGWNTAGDLSTLQQQSGLKTDFDSRELQALTKQMDASNSVANSEVLAVLQYFTLLNALYAFSGFLGGYAVLKSFRFLLKQDLSD